MISANCPLESGTEIYTINTYTNTYPYARCCWLSWKQICLLYVFLKNTTELSQVLFYSTEEWSLKAASLFTWPVALMLIVMLNSIISRNLVASSKQLAPCLLQKSQVTLQWTYKWYKDNKSDYTANFFPCRFTQVKEGKIKIGWMSHWFQEMAWDLKSWIPVKKSFNQWVLKLTLKLFISQRSDDNNLKDGTWSIFWYLDKPQGQ